MVAWFTTSPTSWHALTRRRFTSSAGSRPALVMPALSSEPGVFLAAPPWFLCPPRSTLAFRSPFHSKHQPPGWQDPLVIIIVGVLGHTSWHLALYKTGVQLPAAPPVGLADGFDLTEK